MLKIVSPVALACLLLGSAVTAGAASAVTTPVIPGGINGATFLVCQALNLNKKARDVVLEVVDADSGAVLFDVGQASLSPGLLVTGAGEGAESNTYCRVSGLSPTTTKVTYSVTNSANDVLMSVTAP